MQKRRERLMLALGAGVLLSPLAAGAAPVYVDDVADGDGDGYFETGGHVPPDQPINGENAIGDDFKVGLNPGTSISTYSPNLPAGMYYVQAHWTVNSGHTPSAIYTVAGVPVPVNQQQTAAQGLIPGAWPPNNEVPSDGSGWYTLGQFALTPASTVVLTHGTGVVIADGIRFSTDFVADERRATLDSTTNWTSETITPNLALPGGVDAPANLESTQYLNSTVTSATATYRPGVTGAFEVSASWAVDADNTTQASYVVDLDGIAGGLDSFTFFRDQSGPAGGTWSGYSSLGTFLLTPTSTITLSNAAGAGSLTADGLLIAPGVIPEPASATLLVAGGALLAARRRVV